MGAADQGMTGDSMQGRRAQRQQGTKREGAEWCLTGKGIPWSSTLAISCPSFRLFPFSFVIPGASS